MSKLTRTEQQIKDEIKYLKGRLAQCEGILKEYSIASEKDSMDTADDRANIITGPCPDEGDGLISYISGIKDAEELRSSFEAVEMQVEKRTRELQEANESLRKSEEQFGSVLNAVSESIFLINLEGDILSANTTAAERLGLTVEEVIGRNFFSFIPHDIGLARKKKINEMAASGEPVQFEDKRDGVIFSNTFYPVRDSADNISGLAIFSMDITAQRQSELERERLMLELSKRVAELDIMFNELPYLVSLHGADGRYLRVNPAVVKLFGLDPVKSTREEIAGHIKARFPDGRPLTAENMPSTRALNGEAVTDVEYLFTDADGNEHTLLFNAIPLKLDGSVYGAVFAQIDITERKKTEIALRQSEARYRRLIETTNEGVILDDIHGKITYVNSKMADMLGYPPADITGKECASFLTAEHLDRVQINREKLSKNIPIEDEFCFRRSDGTLLWTLVNSSPLFDDSGYHTGNIAMHTDITDRKRYEEILRESEQRLKYHLENSPLAVIEWDWDFIVTHWSAGAERIFGWRESETVGRRLESINMVYIEDMPIVENTMRRLTGGNELTVVSTNRNYTKSGEVIECTWYNSVLLDDKGRMVSVMSLIQDISERRAMEENLKRRALELTAVNKELEAFSYSISHDLRAPLRRIKGFSSILLEDHINSLNEEGRDFLHRISSGTDKMTGLIDALLVLARITRQEMTPQEINLSVLAGNIVNDLRQAEPARTIDIKIEDDLKTYGDIRLMNIALTNLIGNSWKYTEKAVNPGIEFGTTERDGQAVFFVRDNGAGFDMSRAGKLFIPFQRLHSGHQFPGTGIGLAIVNKIIQRHGGCIWGEGEPGKGATFYFCVSLEKTIHEEENHY